MDKKRRRFWKLYIKFLGKQIKKWTGEWGISEETRLPYLRLHIKAYKEELKIRELLPEFLSEYYGLFAEAEYLFKEEINEKPSSSLQKT